MSTQQDTLNEGFDLADMFDLLSTGPFNRARGEAQLRVAIAWIGHSQERQTHFEELLKKVNLHTLSMNAAEKLCALDYPFLRDEKVK